MKKIKILFIDDDPNMHRLLQFYLSDKKYLLDFAGNGRIAMSRLKGRKYQLIISDLMMPDMDGVTFIKKCRGSGNTTPIIVTSAYDQESKTSEALKAGANSVLGKPFDREQIEQAIVSELNLS